MTRSPITTHIPAIAWAVIGAALACTIAGVATSVEPHDDMHWWTWTEDDEGLNRVQAEPRWDGRMSMAMYAAMKHMGTYAEMDDRLRWMSEKPDAPGYHLLARMMPLIPLTEDPTLWEDLMMYRTLFERHREAIDAAAQTLAREDRLSVEAVAAILDTTTDDGHP